MRVSTNGSYLRALGLLQELHQAVDHTQRQIASGRRILTPSEDPIAAGQSLRLGESLARLEQFDRNISFARNRLSSEETVLRDAGDVLQRVRELTVQANSGAQTNETRSLIAKEMRGLLDSLVQLANHRDGNGRYLFSGNKESVQPVIRAGVSFSYAGDQGQRQIQISESRSIASGDNAGDIFFRVRTGNGVFAVDQGPANVGNGVAGASSVVDPTQYDAQAYTIRFSSPTTYDVLDSSLAVVASGGFQDGDSIGFRGIEVTIDGQPAAADEFVVSPSAHQDVFTTIDRLAAALETEVYDDTSAAALRQEINKGLNNTDQAIGNLLETRTGVGSRLGAIDDTEFSNSGIALVLQESLSDINDLDYAEALSRMSLQATTLEAAQRAFVRTQELSLFNLL